MPLGNLNLKASLLLLVALWEEEILFKKLNLKSEGLTNLNRGYGFGFPVEDSILSVEPANSAYTPNPVFFERAFIFSKAS